MSILEHRPNIDTGSFSHFLDLVCSEGGIVP
jgi:hypothetical protein